MCGAFPALVWSYAWAPCTSSLVPPSPSKLPAASSCKTASSSAETHPAWVTTPGLQQGARSRERSGLCCSQQAWGGTALPASTGRTKNVGTLITKAAAMLPPAHEQLHRSPQDRAEGSGVARSRRAAHHAGSRTGSRCKRNGNSRAGRGERTSRGASRGLVPHGEPGLLRERCTALGQRSRGVSHLQPGEHGLLV